MRAPDVGSAAIADIFVCRPEHVLLVIGQVKHRRAVIADPEISGRTHLYASEAKAAKKPPPGAATAETSLPNRSSVATHIVN
jgi:hypothetical protein